MSKVILTFDYELFLGKKSGTVQKSIIEPINKVIELLQKYNAKAIFFVDVTYLMVLEKFNHKDLKVIKKQLRKIINIGSSIELHLHPQWLDAKPKDNEWEFISFDRYRLHSLKDFEIENLFTQGVNFLEKITNEKILAFRAGGWSITPFKVLKESFIKNDIKLDMSVVPGFYKESLPMHYYDFRNTPNKEYYKFSDDVTIEDKRGCFLEIPVTTYYMNGYDLLINVLIRKLKQDNIFGDGQGLDSANIKKGLIKRIFEKNLRRATIEGQSSYFFKKSLKKLKNRKLLSYVMHPKTLNQTALNNMEYLLKNFITLNSKDIIKDYF
jgi:peptidoglycan/xylan/chitin deacetylase (PgdA/CDA1 family)